MPRATGLSVPEDERLESETQWSGTGTVTNVRLLSNAGKDDVAFATIPLALVGPDSTDASRRRKSDRSRPPGKDQEPAEPHLRIGPVALTTNASVPMNAGGWLSTTGYRFYLRGDMELKDLFQSGQHAGGASSAPRGRRRGQTGCEPLRALAGIRTPNHPGDRSVAQRARCDARTEHAHRD